MTPSRLELVRKLESYRDGRPVPRGETITIPVADSENLAALAFVRMGGEARPWAVGFQVESSDPLIFTVPDGRQTEPIGEMLVKLAGALCGFLGSPLFPGASAVLSPEDPGSLKQVWLPNAAHLGMLHLINLRYTFARADEGSSRTEALKALGRVCGYLFREAARADEVGVVDASQAMRSAFTFPVDDIRGQHLGLLTSYLVPDSTPEEIAEAVRIAEKLPVSPTLDPVLERDDLEPLVDQFNSANREGSPQESERVGAAIREVLVPEVTRRLDLTLGAANILRSDTRPVNAGIDQLVDKSISTREYEYLRLEAALAEGSAAWSPASAETDRMAKSAARRYIRMAGADENRAGALLLNDRELVEEAISAGDGIRGEVVGIEYRKPLEKSQRKTFWIIQVPLALPFRLKVDAQVLTIDEDPPGGYIESVETSDGNRLVSVCMNKKSAGVQPSSESFRGRQVTLMPESGSFAVSKLKNLARPNGPGAWASREAGIRPARGDRYTGDPLDEIASLRKT